MRILIFQNIEECYISHMIIFENLQFGELSNYLLSFEMYYMNCYYQRIHTTRGIYIQKAFVCNL